jgi:hypothetical protein
LNNYHIFYSELKRIGIPVYAAELVFDEQDFQLTSQDATFLLQLKSKDVMFQKERMLNLLLQKLPTEYDNVVWMDCDIFFLDDNWPNRVESKLKEFHVIQPYTYSIGLPNCELSRVSEANWIIYNCQGDGRLIRSFAYYENTRRSYSSFHNGHVGYIWAARREFMDKHKFYDAIITGAGDLFMTMAFSGHFWWIDITPQFNGISNKACFHFFDWGIPVWQETKGKIGYTFDLVVHLWHGDVAHRNYLSHSRNLQLNDFDPTVDLALDENGCWRWNSKKHNLHRALKEIFNLQQVV